MGVSIKHLIIDGTPYAVKVARAVWTWTKSEGIVRYGGSYILDLSGILLSPIIGNYTNVEIFDMQNQNYEIALNNASVIGQHEGEDIRIFCGNDSMAGLDEIISSLTASLISNNRILLEASLMSGENIDHELFFIVVDEENDEIVRVLLRLYNEMGSSQVKFEEISFDFNGVIQ